MKVATPTNRTTGRMRRAKVVNPSSNPLAWATSANASTAPERTARNIVARLKASFQLNARVDNRLQCSVVRIWSRRAGGRLNPPRSASTFSWSVWALPPVGSLGIKFSLSTDLVDTLVDRLLGSRAPEHAVDA